uniref:L-threonylcarbamoyladenylate synthase n=1 Tax=uncultured Draconibacterium sp. TaxID=1573823 RepID=UPI003216A0D8
MSKIISNIDLAANCIRDGKLVAFPTETVYGLGADAFNKEAVAKIFSTKERPAFNPLIVHIANISDLEKLFVKVDAQLLKLVEAFWPGPLTVVAQKHSSVPDIVTAGLNTVAVRMPANNTALELINKAGTPIAAPSANKFGLLSPTTPEHVKKQLPNIEYILDGELPDVGIESTVIELGNGKFKLLRPGVVVSHDIEKVIPQNHDADNNLQIKSPGLLKSHYSPQKPIYLKGYEPENIANLKVGFIAFEKVECPDKFHRIEILSAKGNLNEAAANLFGAMHRLEDSDVDIIIAEPVADTGIGMAIMDRLNKAVYQYNK